MPATRTLLCALAASGCVLAAVPQTDAFWLIPGSGNHNLDVSQSARVLRQRAQDVLPSTEEGPMADLLRALEEVTSDVGATASRAKSSITRGLYMRQSEDDYLLSMDVPGLHTKEISVTTDHGVLHIKGEHKCLKNPVTDKVDPLCIERSYDASFTFPSDADEDRADARIDAGVVFVKVPKVKEARGLGRVLQLTNDAAEWVYDSTKDAYENVRDSVVKNANDATNSIKSAATHVSRRAQEGAEAATDAARTVTNTVKSKATDVSRQAQEAAQTVKNQAADATDKIKGTPVAEEKGFFDRVKDTVRMAGGQGAAKGDIPVQRKEDL